MLGIAVGQMACLKVLYGDYPECEGDSFVEIRQWETADGNNSDLIVEHGQLDEAGELQTQCRVMPFFLTVREVLETVGI